MRVDSKNKTAFTLVELMITVIIIGVVASFGIPNYTRSVAKSREKDALQNLNLIREALKLYMVREETPPVDLGSVAAINAMLTINVMEQSGNVYTCQNVAGPSYRCNSVNSIDGWTLSFILDTDNGEVFCGGGTCPTL